MTFGSHFGIDFSTFFKNRKTLILMTLTWFWHVFRSQNLSFSSSFFMDFSCIYRNPPKRAFCRGNWSVLVPFSIFGISKKAHFAHHSRLKTDLLFPRRRTGSVFDPTLAQTATKMVLRRPETRFSSILDRFSIDFRPICLDFYSHSDTP